jgi:hypothetical protein
MDEHPDIDRAIDTAAKRTIDAEHQLETEPLDSPDLVPRADVVERRAEDLHELARDAADQAHSDET